MTTSHYLVAASHYLSQCWPRSLSSYGITRPQWVNYWKTVSLCSISQIPAIRHEVFQYLHDWTLYQQVLHCLNSLVPGRPGCHFKTAIFNPILLIGILTLFKDNALRWMPRNLTDDKSTLVQVMAWCHQTTSHYLSQCWPRSMSPNGITRPQWVNLLGPGAHYIESFFYGALSPGVLSIGYKLISIISISLIFKYSHN